MSATHDVQALYERHYLSLVRLAAHLVDDLETAEDIVQDVFAALSGKALTSEPLRYLQRAVMNRSRSVLRRRRVARAFLAHSSPLDDIEPADADALRAERRRAVLTAIARLPQRQREIVVLRFYEDQSVGEIAELLDISAGAVSSSLHRALTTLQDRIGAHHDH